MYISVIFLVLALVLQSLASIKQAKELTTAFADLRQDGNVLVGKYKKFLRGGAYFIAGIDKNGYIFAAKGMYGKTVFAKLHNYDEFIGSNIKDISSPKKILNQAINDAKTTFLSTTISN